MGRRKERRLAAMAAASGRRVKLDIFADPSGKESSLQEEAGGDVSHDQKPGGSASPSSSGKNEENPLSLLGQYSDEDSDEKEIDQPNSSTMDKSPLNVHPGDDDAQNVQTHADEGSVIDDTEVKTTEVDNEKQQGVCSAGEGSTAPIKSEISELETADQTFPDSSGMQIVGDAGESWKIVMHRESNHCYYWNTVSGETSWELPVDLASGAASNVTMSYQAEAAVQTLAQENIAVYTNGSAMEAYGNMVMDCTAGQVMQDPYSYAATVASFSGADSSLNPGMTTLQPSTNDSADVNSNHLVTYGLSLFQRLNLLERTKTLPDELVWKKNEIEVRMADCKALSAYGASLLPLWWHIDQQFKEIESIIYKVESTTHTELNHHSKEEPYSGDVHLVNENEALPLEGEKVSASGCKDVEVDISSDCPVSETVSSVERSSSGMTLRSSEVEHLVEDSKTHATCNVDDDMDVDMEVDEDGSANEEPVVSVRNRDYPLVQPAVPSCTSTSECPSVPGVVDSPPPPPPPDDDWIPPPPPEDEFVPPPPPPTLPQAEDIAFSHDHYGVTTSTQPNGVLTIPKTDYFVPSVPEVTEGCYYAVGSQLVELPPLSYYAPLTVGGPINTAPVETLSYYSIPVTESPAVAPTASATVFSAYYSASVAANSNDVSSSLPVEVSVLSEKCFLPDGSKDASVPATSMTEDNTLMPGTSAVPASSKTLAKAVREKKRTVSVSSKPICSKKVSTLLDKWKAAKEELREEAEPEDPLEKLEKKRQKEIEQWHAQQIASGEAEDNANFVPLGADWRERVKRRRMVMAKKESVEASSSVAADHGKTEPDIAGLSKDLPPGWQAYWDESSRQVYYGNQATSETSWTRPTN